MYNVKYANTEVWKDIKGFEGHYKINRSGVVVNVRRGTQLTQTTNPAGYFRITLCKNNKRSDHLLHRLIAEAFIPKKDGKNHINHKNGVRDDNGIENLEWCDSLDNSRHRYRNTKYVKITNEQLEEMYEMSHQFSLVKVAHKYGLTAFKVHVLLAHMHPKYKAA